MKIKSNLDKSDLAKIERMKKKEGVYEPSLVDKLKSGLGVPSCVVWAYEKLGLHPRDVNPMFMFRLVEEEFEFLKNKK